VLDNRRSGAIKYFPDMPIQDVTQLAYFYVTHKYLSLWETESEVSKFRHDTGPTSNEASASKQKSLAVANTSFNTANAEEFHELDDLKEPEASPVLKTTNASEAIQDKTAKNWANSLEKAVALAVECARNDVPKSIKQHQTMWAQLWGDTESNEPRKAAFRAFRKGLPSELKHRKKE